MRNRGQSLSVVERGDDPLRVPGSVHDSCRDAAKSEGMAGVKVTLL